MVLRIRNVPPEKKTYEVFFWNKKTGESYKTKVIAINVKQAKFKASKIKQEVYKEKNRKFTFFIELEQV